MLLDILLAKNINTWYTMFMWISCLYTV